MARNRPCSALKALLEKRQADAHENNQRLDDAVFAATFDPRHPLQAPKRLAVPPALNFAPLDNAASALTEAAQRYKAAAEKAGDKLAADPATLAKVNARLMQSERALLDPAGLPRREWFRHLLYAPGYYTGYSVKTMPGVRESIEQKDYPNVEPEVFKLAKALQREIDLINGAAQALEPHPKPRPGLTSCQAKTILVSPIYTIPLDFANHTA